MERARKTVLTVEDSPNLRKLISYNLKRAGYDVLEAGDGKQAVAVLQKTIPDLILLDIRMPEMDGFQLLSLMRRFPKAASIPVIMLTALSHSRELDHALSLGVADYLVKPLDPMLLLSKVTCVLRNDDALGGGYWSGPNRRQFIRGAISPVSLAPSPGGVGLDLGEGGIAWNAADATDAGTIIPVESRPLCQLLGLSPRPLRARVVYSVERGRTFRVGARLIGLDEATLDAIRRYAMAQQRPIRAR